MTEKGDHCQVRRCKRPVPDGMVLCDACLEELEEAIADLPALAHALDASYLRQQRFSVASIAIPDPDEATIPFNDKAGRLRRRLTRELLRWVLHVHDAHAIAWVRTANTAESMSAALLRALPYFQSNPAGAEAHAALVPLRTTALKAVDRPPDLVYLGVCSVLVEGVECPEDLYAEWGKPLTRCRKCKTNHDVDDRRSVLIVAVKDQLATASDIARGLSGIGMNVTSERIRQWKKRGRIVERGPGYGGNPLYRVGDVIDRVLEDAERQERRKA